MVRRDGEEIFYEDLRPALQTESADPRGEWRVHFHVPIYLQEFGQLFSTQEQIAECVACAARYSGCPHYEVETYAWGVLPPHLRQPDLAAGIAQELQWFAALRESLRPRREPTA